MTIKLRDYLKVGEKYVIRAKDRREHLDHVNGSKREIRMKLVGLYPHIADLERPAGYRESFTYWELERILVR